MAVLMNKLFIVIEFVEKGSLGLNNDSSKSITYPSVLHLFDNGSTLINAQ